MSLISLGLDVAELALQILRKNFTADSSEPRFKTGDIQWFYEKDGSITAVNFGDDDHAITYVYRGEPGGDDEDRRVSATSILCPHDDVRGQEYYYQFPKSNISINGTSVDARRVGANDMTRAVSFAFGSVAVGAVIAMIKDFEFTFTYKEVDNKRRYGFLIKCTAEVPMPDVAVSASAVDDRGNASSASATSDEATNDGEFWLLFMDGLTFEAGAGNVTGSLEVSEAHYQAILEHGKLAN